MSLKEWNKKYLTRFIRAMIAYALLLPISLLLIGSGRIESIIGKQLIALLPVIPFLFAMTAVINNVRQLDELQQRIHLESMLITTLLTGGLSFSYGLLEASDLVPHLPAVWIAPFMIAVWGTSNAIIGRRYQ